MTGTVMLIFSCVACGNPSTGNPKLVPSILVSRDANGEWQSDRNGTREPICRPCAEVVAERARRGEVQADPNTLTPEYFDRAYGTGAEESEF